MARVGQSPQRDRLVLEHKWKKGESSINLRITERPGQEKPWRLAMITTNSKGKSSFHSASYNSEHSARSHLGQVELTIQHSNWIKQEGSTPLSDMPTTNSADSSGNVFTLEDLKEAQKLLASMGADPSPPFGLDFTVATEQVSKALANLGKTAASGITNYAQAMRGLAEAKAKPAVVWFERDLSVNGNWIFKKGEELHLSKVEGTQNRYVYPDQDYEGAPGVNWSMIRDYVTTEKPQPVRALPQRGRRKIKRKK